VAWGSDEAAKGILRADDALRAVIHGASGIIVSNHGARQLDTTPATISVLPEIVDAVAGAVAQSDGLWRAGGVGRAPDTLVTGGWWRNWGQVRSGDAASRVRSGHGAVRLPKARRHYQRSCPSLVGLGNVPGSASALARLRFVSFPATAPWIALRNQTVSAFLRMALGPEFRQPHILICIR
jgi:hypothetical protein